MAIAALDGFMGDDGGVVGSPTITTRGGVVALQKPRWGLRNTFAGWGWIGEYCCEGGCGWPVSGADAKGLHEEMRLSSHAWLTAAPSET